MKKKYRVKKSDEIQQLMSKRQSVGNSYFILYYQKNHDFENFRYALSVPKKYGKAHERNLMKRRIREIIKVKSIDPACEFFVIARIKSKELSFSQITENVQELLKKANLLKERVK